MIPYSISIILHLALQESRAKNRRFLEFALFASPLSNWCDAFCAIHIRRDWSEDAMTRRKRRALIWVLFLALSPSRRDKIKMT